MSKRDRETCDVQNPDIPRSVKARGDIHKHRVRPLTSDKRCVTRNTHKH